MSTVGVADLDPFRHSFRLMQTRSSFRLYRDSEPMEYMLRDPIRVYSGLDCASCDGLIDINGECKCSY